MSLSDSSYKEAARNICMDWSRYVRMGGQLAGLGIKSPSLVWTPSGAAPEWSATYTDWMTEADCAEISRLHAALPRKANVIVGDEWLRKPEIMDRLRAQKALRARVSESQALSEQCAGRVAAAASALRAYGGLSEAATCERLRRPEGLGAGALINWLSATLSVCAELSRCCVDKKRKRELASIENNLLAMLRGTETDPVRVQVTQADFAAYAGVSVDYWREVNSAWLEKVFRATASHA